MTAQHNGWPEWLKIGGDFINRVGFPIVAFLLLCYITFHSLEKQTEVLDGQVKALIALSTSFENFKCEVVKEHAAMIANQDKLKERIFNK